MTPRPVAIALVAAVALVALGAPTRASAEPPTIYKWVDDQGVAHYTTDRGRIPRSIETRIERAPSATAPAPVATHPEDEMRDAVRPRTAPVSAAPPPAAQPEPAPVAAPPPPAPKASPIAGSAAPTPAPPPAPAPAPVASKAAPPAPSQPYEEPPAPLATDAKAEVDPVSAPPPAPLAPLAPKQSAELAKIDGQIKSLEAEISEREEKLAALISTADGQRSAPLVDDPNFREISQRLPKLQAELQTLRARRNEIQPTATP